MFYSAVIANSAENTSIQNVSILANFETRQLSIIGAANKVAINGLYVNTFETKDQVQQNFRIFLETDNQSLNTINNMGIYTSGWVNLQNIGSISNSYIITSDSTPGFINRVDETSNIYTYSINNLNDFNIKSLNELSFDSNIWVKNTTSSLPTLKNANVKQISSVVVPEELNVNIGEIKNIEATINPTDVFNSHLLYSSSDESVATVDQEGNVTGIETGSAIITVRTRDGNNITKIIDVVVGTEFQITYVYKDHEESNSYTFGTTIQLPTYNENGEFIKGWASDPTRPQFYRTAGEEYTIRTSVEFYAVYENDILSESLYEHDSASKMIKKICMTTVEHYIENLRLSSEYTAKVFVGEDELTEGKVPTDSVTKIYNSDNTVVAEYTNSVLGDVYKDGNINSRDAGMIIRYLLDMENFSDAQKLSADFSKDEKVKLNDVLMIKQYVVHIGNYYEGVCPNAD